MTIACERQLRFAGTKRCPREGFQPVPGVEDDWHIKIPDRAALVNTSSGGLNTVCALLIKAGDTE